MADADFTGDILIVDDTSPILDLLERILTRVGHRVRTALTGEEALKFVKAFPPDLVILDIFMPHMDGFEVCQHLKSDASTASIPVLFISGVGDVENKIKAFEIGGVDYLTKPLQSKEVVARVKTHLTLRRYEQALESRVEERTRELSQLIAAYERFVPQQFLRFLQKERITDVQLADQVEHHMTIMFADIRNFTQLSEGMNPQENFNFLNSYLSRVSPVISQHRGFIDKYIGDEIMALFPECSDDAVEAAIELQRELAVYNQHRASCGYSPVHVGTGAHTGLMMLGIIGEEERMEGTVIADAVNLASRLESLTKLYGVEILISEATRQDLKREGAQRMRFLDEVRVKGRTDSVKLYEVFHDVDEAKVDVRMASLAAYEGALVHYQKGDLKAARRGFLSVLEKLPGDRATEVFLGRIDRFLEEGLPENWDGIQIFQH